MSNEPYVLITADTHAGGSHAQYREYLDPQYRDAFDEWRGGYKNPALEHYGSKKLRNWDLEIRTQGPEQPGRGRRGGVPEHRAAVLPQEHRHRATAATRTLRTCARRHPRAQPLAEGFLRAKIRCAAPASA